MKSYSKLIEKTELALKRGDEIEKPIRDMLESKTGSQSVETWNDAVNDWLDDTEAKYIEWLAQRAPHRLSYFIEYMTPDEPPPTHIEMLCEYLEMIERREIMRLCVSMPPGHAKTKTCSRLFPVWYLGRNPKHRWLHAGHSQGFAEKQFGIDVRDYIMDPKFTAIFPEMVIQTRGNQLPAPGGWRAENGRGGYVCKGVGQKIAGYRGHCGAGDDLLGSREDAFSATIRQKVWDWLWADFRTRFLPGSPLFLIATRWHPDDPMGRIEAMNKAGMGIPWEVINLTAIVENDKEMAMDLMGRDIGETLWSDYYTVQEILEFKNTLPSVDWWALYKGQPRDDEGNVVKSAWFGRYDRLPVNRVRDGRTIEKRVKRITLSIDCAVKANQRSSYSVITVWVEDVMGYHYLADVYRQRLEYNELVALIKTAADKWEPNSILIEDKGHGSPIIQQHRQFNGAPVIAINPDSEGDKEFRFDGVTPYFEAGQVLLPKNAPWLSDYEGEVLAFPNSAYKDQVDATSQYFTHLSKRGRRGGTRKLVGV